MYILYTIFVFAFFKLYSEVVVKLIEYIYVGLHCIVYTIGAQCPL